jgi:hypothetical protein
MIDITLADSTTHTFESVEVRATPLPVGYDIERPATTWRVVACLPRQAGGFWIGLERAIMHVVDIHGRRPTEE